LLNYSLVQNTKVLIGNGTVAQLGELLKEAGYNKPMLVYDKGVKEIGIITKIEKVIKKAGLSYIEFDEVLPDPPDYIIEKGAKVCEEEKCDCVVSIGGGSSIDTGKGISVLRFNEGPILKYGNPGIPMNQCKGIINIPTTSGTGSELSCGIIVSDEKNALKVPIVAYNAMSEYAVIDPELSIGMPAGLTAITGLDVFSHAAEAYTSIISNVGADMICEKIMETVFKYLPVAVEDGKNAEARTAMAVSASLGGWMLTNACAHVGHSVAHVIGSKYHIPHGAACAYGFQAMIEYIASVCPDKVKKIGIILGAEFKGGETPEKIAELTNKAYKAFRDDVLKLKSIKEYNCDPAKVEDCAHAIEVEIFAGLCPKKVTYEGALDLVKKTLEI